jgi:thioredoxin-like negative regulator of GroEL
MTFELDRGDMKLLTECGYSGVLRNIKVDISPIFEALSVWMPEQAAGPIGQALRELMNGQFKAADDRLNRAILEASEGKAEARAVLALCKALQKDMTAAGKLAEELAGEGGAAEEFTSLLVKSDDSA